MDEHYLTEIEIKQFKCFSDFKAAGFKRVNLIGGKNNVGKTAFMEACYINLSSVTIGNLITALIQIKVSREKLNLVGKDINVEINKFLDSTQNYSSYSNLSKKIFDVKQKDAVKEYQFTINGQLTTINANALNITPDYADKVIFKDNFGWSNEWLIRFYQVIQKQDLEYDLNAFANEFDDSISSFKVIGEKPQCKIKDEYRDITEFGDGLTHYISIICALYNCENGYLFIDEIDNGIHYSQLDRLWEIIFTLSKKTNCQVFATTHSKEMLESFARVAKKLDEQDISYTILVKDKKQEIKTISMDYALLQDSMAQGHEVR
jgi:AAA15 family ATPase/GTPase